MFLIRTTVPDDNVTGMSFIGYGLFCVEVWLTADLLAPAKTAATTTPLRNNWRTIPSSKSARAAVPRRMLAHAPASRTLGPNELCLAVRAFTARFKGIEDATAAVGIAGP